MADDRIEASAGTKMIYLIKRRPDTSREELVAHWFGYHMPIVIESQRRQAERGRRHAWRYIATLFDPGRDGEHPWDGMAQLWWDVPLPRPDAAHGTEPTDSFQQKAEPYWPWPTREYVVIDGAEHLASEPLEFGTPFPNTRSGFFKVSFLVKARPDTDHDAFFAHWLNVHVPNVRSVMEQVDGFRYAVSHSLEPRQAPYAGLAELYFHKSSAWDEYRRLIRPDGMEQWVDTDGMLVLRARTEMIGIP